MSVEQPAPQKPATRGWIIAVSIIIGIIFACALLPLGGFALLLAAGSSNPSIGPIASPPWEEQLVEGSGTDRIVIIEVSGAIGAAADPFSLQLSQGQLLSQIRQASRDNRVKAVVLRVDSPGGGVVASSELHEKLRDLREDGKILVVSMGSTAASGGYYISTPAHRIYANPDTLTGSLG
ncbi:MAG: S49 family peptidase, partial [Chloroflexia bacterium]|nr:S49 family peptidase [Chloroflexia bacterium]